MTIPSSSQSSPSVNRKLLKRPDVFLKSLQNMFVSLPQYRRPLAFLIAGTFVVILAILFFTSQGQKKEDRARDALYSARETFEQELKTLEAKEAPQKSAEQLESVKALKSKEVPAPKASVRFRVLDVDQQFPQGTSALKKMISEYGSSRSAYEAKLLLGNLYYDHGDPTKAVEWFKRAADTSPGKFEKAVAYHSLGFAFENSKKFEDSLKARQQALQLGFSELKGDLLMAIARNYESLNDHAKAKSTYDQIIKELPDTQYATSAQNFRAQLQ